MLLGDRAEKNLPLVRLACLQSAALRGDYHKAQVARPQSQQSFRHSVANTFASSNQAGLIAEMRPETGLTSHRTDKYPIRVGLSGSVGVRCAFEPKRYFPEN